MYEMYLRYLLGVTQPTRPESLLRALQGICHLIWLRSIQYRAWDFTGEL
jgi:hypothetical protein